MLKFAISILLAAVLLIPSFVHAQSSDGCAPEFRAVAEFGKVTIRGEGETDVVVVSDPLCWHCRLGHKLLGEYPELYRSVTMVFFPRKSFIGSDMAAWILEDAVGGEHLEAMVDFAYDGLKQPKAEDVNEARMIVLAQFVNEFPHMVKGTDIPELFVRLGLEQNARVLEGAELASTANLPGTPILISGSDVVLGYAPGKWLEVLKKQSVCK